MKKGLLIFGFLILLIAGGAWYLLSGAGDFIRVQIEQQGSKFLGTSVTVSNVDLALTEGRLTINGLEVANPDSFSDANAFSLGAITLDLGDVVSEPYTVQTVSIDAPEILYELDSGGKGNLLVLKENLTARLPKNQAPAQSSETGPNPMVIVENVIVSKVSLKLDFENVDTGELKVDTKSYDVTLPTFSAGSIGKPNGMPADQVGAAIAQAMLDNVITQAKSEAKKRLGDIAKQKAKEKIDKEKEKLKEKAKDKLKDLLGNG